MANWTSKEDEILINFVRLHEVLYDVKHQNYRKPQLKKDLWCKLGKILNKKDTVCYKRWCTVRDYYIRRRGKQGKQTYVGEAWKKRARLLSFLDKYSWIRRSSTNYSNTKSTEVDSPKEDAQDNNEIYMIHVTEDAEDPLSVIGDSIDICNKSNNSEEDSKHIDEYEETAGIQKNLKLKHRHLQDHIDLIKKEEISSTENNGNNSEEDYKLEHEETRKVHNLKRKHRQAQDNLDQILSSTVYKVQRDPSTESDWDETDLFFSSIAKVVKKLPRREQIELRMQIGSLVGKAELRCLAHDSPQPSTSANDYPELTTALQNSRGGSNKYLEISVSD